MQTIKLVDHPRAGTLPDFGNFRIAGPSRGNADVKVESYDSYVGVAEMMPLAKGVSVKPRVWDFKGNSSDIDLLRMMKIVVDAGYRGHCGIEHGPEGNELGGVRQLARAARGRARSAVGQVEALTGTSGSRRDRYRSVIRYATTSRIWRGVSSRSMSGMADTPLGAPRCPTPALAAGPVASSTAIIVSVSSRSVPWSSGRSSA